MCDNAYNGVILAELFVTTTVADNLLYENEFRCNYALFSYVRTKLLLSVSYNISKYKSFITAYPSRFK